jgi:phosphoglycerate dehydrogenase-like enzyme
MDRLCDLADVDPGLVAERFDEPRARAALADAEVLITGWGSPPVDEAVLALAPRLRAVLHAAGSVKGLLHPACWHRGLRVTSAAGANGEPVAEYALAAVLLAGKGVFAQRERYRAERHFAIGAILPDVGNHRRRVGVIGASRIGRRLVELLRPFDLDVLLHDPYLGAEEAAALGVRHAPDLDALLASCSVVSVHAPALPETRGLLSRRRLALLPDGAVLVNTARGELVDTAALAEEVAAGRLTAVLDVTQPEPLPPDSPLFDLPGAFLTPHVAGSHGNELERLGRSVLTELELLIAGRPADGPVHLGDLPRTA